MSLRRKVSHFLALVVIAALAVGIIAEPASAKMSAKQKAQVRAKLRKQVKKNPGVIRKKSFMKKAALVNFKLPITVRLRTGDLPGTPGNEAAALNTNRATIDLGASLGQREVNLGGSLAGEITFKDSYDGGALGNVDLALNPGPKGLTSTSIPLLWNTNVSGNSSRYDANFLNPLIYTATSGAGPFLTPGCADFVGSSNLNFGVGVIDSPLVPGVDTIGLPGFPFHSLAGPGGSPEGFLPVDPGVDNINDLLASKEPGNPNALGGNPDPFPVGTSYDPLQSNTAPSVKDTVLRTAPLSLQIAAPGTTVPQDGSVPNGVAGSENLVIGKSGGQANLFGNIPGKSYGIDVTVSLATKISSIFRIVDQDITGANLNEGDDWPAGIFTCRQVYSGGVQNYIPGVRLTGNLKISPGITSDGHLRIAKATLQSPANSATRFAVAACLVPYASYNTPQNGSDGYPVQPSKVPTPAGFPGTQPVGTLPSDVDTIRPTPAANCNDQPTGLVAYSALAPAEVGSMAPAVPANGYSTNASGSTVSVAADLAVNTVSADVLVGDTP